MAPLLKKRRVIAVEQETTPGTAETLVAADAAMNAYDVMIQPNIEIERRMGQGAYAEDLSGVSGQRAGTATFRTDVWWDGTSTEPYWASELLPACGWVLDGNVFNNYLEVPGSNVKTVTIGAYIDGVFKSIYGASGNWRLVCPTGRMAYIEWTFQGVWATPTDVAIIGPTYPTDAPIKYSAATTTFNSNNLCVENLTFDAGNVLTAKECPDNAAGIDYFLITDRSIIVTANPEAALVATADHYGDLINHTEAVLSVTLDGPSNSTIAITAAKAQVQNIQEGDRNGIVTDEITWQVNRNGATDGESLLWTFTPTV